MSAVKQPQDPTFPIALAAFLSLAMCEFSSALLNYNLKLFKQTIKLQALKFVSATKNGKQKHEQGLLKPPTADCGNERSPRTPSTHGKWKPPRAKGQSLPSWTKLCAWDCAVHTMSQP